MKDEAREAMSRQDPKSRAQNRAYLSVHAHTCDLVKYMKANVDTEIVAHLSVLRHPDGSLHHILSTGHTRSGMEAWQMAVAVIGKEFERLQAKSEPAIYTWAERGMPCEKEKESSVPGVWRGDKDSGLVLD